MSRAHSRIAPKITTPCPDWTRATLLLVDDNHELRGAAADLLRGHGATVLEAESVTSADRQWRAHPEVDAVVSDVRMPGDSGVVLADRIRQERGELPILLVSSHLDASLEARLAAGDVAFRRKPFSLDDLLAGLDEARSCAQKNTAQPTPPRPSRRPAPRRALWTSLAAVVLAVTVGLSVWGRGSSPPPLPDVDETSQRRSFRVEPLAPRGALIEPPKAMDWRPVDGAARYHLTVWRPGDEILWQGDVVVPPMDLPEPLLGEIVEAVRFSWRVDAFDAEGRKIAWSEAARFWLAPLRFQDSEGPED